MTKPPRWIAAAIAQAARRRARMPWERGLRRAAFSGRRAATASAVLPTRRAA